MSFKRLEHFPGNDVAGFIQALGMRFGAHVNAHTSYDGRSLSAPVPTDNRSIVDRALLVMEDWARTPCRFNPAEVEKERGVVTRGMSSASARNHVSATPEMSILLEGCALRRAVADPDARIIRRQPRTPGNRFYAILRPVI